MWLRALRIVALLSFALSSAFVAHAVPTAEDKESARNLFRMGDEKFRVGDFEGALVSFKAADAIMGVPTTGLEVGRTLAKLGKLIEAREKLQEVANLEAEEGELQVQEDARAEARALFLELGSRIPSVEVRLKTADGETPAGVTVEIDGERLRHEAALLPRRVNPGGHVVVVTARGYAREERKVHLVEAQRQVIEVELSPRRPERSPAPAPPPPDPDPDARSDSHDASPAMMTAGVALLGLGGASLLVGAVTGILTLVDAEQIAERCPDKRCTAEDEPLLDKAVALSHVSTGTLAAGGALAGTGVLLLILGLVNDAGPASASASVATPSRWTPIVGVGFVGLRGTL